jgi:hypothetical protein
MMPSRALPSGPWEVLFQQALTVIDEIRQHGGVSDPFVTFGGGTVLMLRYDHRMSKDIDLFVPDPQSLGFVTPRLSDVADSLCDSQYVEANNYVKLQLPQGEIDFVASPNLLAPQHAFEVWNLFGHDVRVETAAEIVAKKMFHRGDKATARDLFDLAMVIEREPAALSQAQPFFYRHAGKFIEHVSAPSAGFIRQFMDIDARSYQPTFEHAASKALAYFDDMDRDLARSAEQARLFVGDKGYSVQAVDTERGNYVGKPLHTTAHHLVQDLGRATVAIHEKHRLPVEVSNPAHDVSLHLRYAHGAALSLSNSRSNGIER